MILEIKIYKRLCGIMTAIIMLLLQIPILAESGADLIVTNVRISKENYSVGDKVSFYVDVANIGTEACNCGWVYISVSDGAQKKSGEKQMSMWARPKIYPGEYITFELSDFYITAQTVSYTAYCNSSGSVDESNKSNNTFKGVINPAGNNIDLTISDVKISKTDFKQGDDVNFILTVKNNGTKKLDYEAMNFILTFPWGEEQFKSVHAMEGLEKLEIVSPKITICANKFDFQVDVNAEGTILEGNYTNNTYNKLFTSYLEIPYVWDSVRMGGGGYVPGIYIHPDKKDYMFAVTDVGGAYKWNKDINEWVCVTDSVSLTKGSDWGVMAIAFDPNDSNVVYGALGGAKSGHEGQQHMNDLYKSTDSGETWTPTNAPVNYTGNIDKGYRYTVAVDPNCSNIIYTGSKSEGLFRTNNATDKVLNWEKVELPGFSETEDSANGIFCVAFDKNSFANGRTQRIYVASAKNGIYISEDGGQSFSLMENSPTKARDMLLNSKGDLYVNSSDSATGGILVYSDEEWKNISPFKDKRYTGFDINPLDESVLAACDLNNIYISENNGTSWNSITDNVNKEDNILWHHDGHFLSNMSHVVFDPHRLNTLYTGDWYGVWKTDDVTETPTKWKDITSGIEECCMRYLCAKPQGTPLYTGCQDNAGYICKNIFEFPEKRMSDDLKMQDCAGIDFCEKNPDIMVMTGGWEWGGGRGLAGYSTDGCDTVKSFETFPLKENGDWLNGARIVLSSDVNEAGMPTVVYIPVGEIFPYRSDDLGKTWTTIDTLPKNMIKRFIHFTDPIDSDTVNSNVFYCYDADTGNFLVSHDSAKSFAQTAKLPIGCYMSFVNAVPGAAGHVFVSINKNGLYYSDDYGKTFNKISSVQSSQVFSIGKEAPDSKFMTLYLYGCVNDIYGFFASTDNGKTWQKLQSKYEEKGGNPEYLEADRQTYGMFYLVWGGRGTHVAMRADNNIAPPKLNIKNLVTGETFREEKISLQGFVNKKSTVLYSLNGGAEQSLECSGDFVLPLKLKKGKNNLFIYALDEKGHKSDKLTYDIFYDADYINLKINQKDGLSRAENIKISGNVNTLNSDGTIDINGQKVKVNEKDLSFETYMPLYEGQNKFTVTASDINGNINSKTVTINKDFTAPVLTLSTNSSVSDNVLYTLTGRVNEPCDITVGNKITSVRDENNLLFTINVALNSGENNIMVNATDLSGNTSSQTISISFAPDSRFPDKPTEVYAYRGTPIIDGFFDEQQWALNRVASKLYSGNSDNYAVFGMMYDESNLYIAVDVYDKAIFSGDSALPPQYNMDTVEFCFDPQMNHAESFDELDLQLRAGLSDNLIYCSNSKTVKGSLVKSTKQENGYSMEIAIPWSAINVKYANELSFGFDLAVNDNDDGSKSRIGAFGWTSDSNGYNNTSLYGTTILK